MTEATAYRPLIVVNPGANKGRTSSLTATLEGILRDLGSDAEISESGEIGESRRHIYEAVVAGRHPIVACGGDGTINAVANSLMDADYQGTMGIIAAGSGNDYATRALGLSRDLRVGVETALYGRPQPVDAARINDHWMVNAFGAGLDANVAWDVRDQVQTGQARVSGDMLYTVSAVNQVLFHYDLPRLEITLDGKLWGTRRMMLAAVMLGPTAGGGFRLAPGADPSDGLLDVLLASRMPRAKALFALPLAKMGRHLWLREVTLIRARHVRIRCAQRVKGHLDGELVSDRTFDIRVHPGALRVLVPR
jgi:diacylglycerol kinase (ATP)